MTVNSEMSETPKLLVKLSSNSISLCWEALGEPSSEVPDEYIIKYRPKGTTKFSSLQIDPKACKCTIDNLQDDTEYDIIIFTSIDGEEKKLERTTLKTESSMARHFMSFSEKSGGSPDVYSLVPSRIIHKKQDVRFCYFGDEQKSIGVQQKTLIVFGETGAGKSTLLDAMFNYIAGVSHSDDFRFQLVNLTDNEKLKAKATFLSLTNGITCYQIPQKGNTVVDYNLCVIDTPGFGDTRGETFDKTIPKKVEELFNDCIDSLDAICLVVPTACVRLTKAQKYVFSSIKQLFGKDAASNICVLLTKDDGATGKPEVLGSIEEAGIKIPEDSYFRFNNADLLSKGSSMQAWQRRNENFRHFFDKLGSMETISLCFTKDVLKSRQMLEIHIEHIRDSIRNRVIDVMNIRRDKKNIDDNEMAIRRNENFEMPVIKKVPTTEQQEFSSLNCTECLETCHRMCTVRWPYGLTMWSCVVFKDRSCTICKCHRSKHDVQKFTHTTKCEIKTETLDDMKRRYEVAVDEASGLDAILEKNKRKYKESLVDLDNKLSEAAVFIEKLKQIALEPAISSLKEFLTLLIEQERNDGTVDLESRLCILMKMRELKEMGCPLTDLMKEI